MLALPLAAKSETFILHTGERIEGSVAMSSPNSVFIALDDGFLRPTVYQEILEVVIDLDGTIQAEVRGRLLAWQDGVYTVQIGDKVLNVRDGTIVPALPANDLGTLPAQSPKPRPTSRPLDTGRSTVKPTM